MGVLLAFAFLAGFATVLSPCILPILPALLAGSSSKGTMRPFGIIFGLILSFIFFTLSLTAIVHATGISPNILRYVAIGLLFVFGLVMIFPMMLPRLSDFFAKISAPLAETGLKLQASGRGTGFFSGTLFGAALGLLWTPCAGPILASITTLVATRSVDLFTILLTVVYSLGAGIPLFFIAFGGNRMLQSSKFLSSHAERIRQIFGVLTVLTAVAIALHWDTAFQTTIADTIPSIILEDNTEVQKALQSLRGEITGPEYQIVTMGKEGMLSNYGKAPNFRGIANWINSPPLTMEALKGKTVLIDFWTYSCINCLRTLPYLEKWYADYKDKGFIIVGVHTPEFEFEKDTVNVEEAAKRLGVLYPIAQDNNYETWQAFHNHYWPAHYLIDAKGDLRMMHFGEGAYGETENAIRELLGLGPLQMKEEVKSSRPISPETYLGIERGNRYASGIDLKWDTSANYNYKPPLDHDTVGLKGAWKAEKQSITSESNDSFLDYNFLATRVYLVLSGSGAIQVSLDGKPYEEIQVDGAMKYDVVKTDYGSHQLSLKVPKGVSAYAFTFGDE